MRKGHVHLLFNWWLIHFHIKIDESSFNWHATSYICTVVWELPANQLQIYLIASQQIGSLSQCELRGNKLASFEPTTSWVTNLQVSSLRGFTSTEVDLSIAFERTHQFFSTFCILRFFIKLMFEILDIFMLVPDIYPVVFISLKSIVTLDSN